MGKTSVIKTGFQCNNNCVFCIQNNSRDQKKTLTTEEVKKILKKNYEISREVVLTGGEVTIRKDIFELVGFAKHCGYETIQIQSNGRMFFYMDFCKRLIDAGANEFCVSVHGSNPQIYDDLIGVKGGFKQLYQGLSNLKDLKQKICTNVVVTKLNYKDLANIFKMLSGFNISECDFSFLCVNQNIAKNEKLIEKIVSRYTEVRPYIENCLYERIDNSINVRLEAFPFCVLGEKYHSFVKRLCVPNNVVYEENEVFDFMEKKVMSDIGKEKFEKCKQCKFYDRCEGPWISYVKIFGSDEFNPIK